MPAARVIQLRELLSEKFPSFRSRIDEVPAVEKNWPTGLAQIDEPLAGGLPQGAFTEVIAPENTAGSATLLRTLLQRAAAEKQIIALVDGGDAFEATQMDEAALSRLLWVRCRSGDEALRAADLLLRDSNLSLIALDLQDVSQQQLRKIPMTTWYRFQRLIETTSTVGLVFTPRPMVSPAEVRITVQSHFSLPALECPATELLQTLQLEISAAKHFRETVREKFA